MRILPLVFTLGTVLDTPTWAQDPHPSLSGVHALTGITVWVEPGVLEENWTVVIDRGLVRAAGRNVEVPPGAEVLAGDGLFVSPGFVVFGPAILPRPESPPRTAAEDLAAGPSNLEAVGVTPTRRVSEHWDGKSDPLPSAPWLKAGVTGVLTYPDGGLVAGQVGLVATAGSSAADRVLAEGVALSAGLARGRGGYPSSSMGVVALFRQTWLDAARHVAWVEASAQNPNGLPTPPERPDLLALGKKTRPILWSCRNRTELRQALGLSSEFGITPWVRGAESLGQESGRLAQSGAFAILDLTERQVTYEATEHWLKEGPGTSPNEAEADASVDVQIRRRRAAKEQEDLEPWARAGKILTQEGVPWAVGVEKPDGLRSGIQTQLKFGLSEDAVLRALTTEPASRVGLAKVLGRVAPGYRADLAVFVGHPFRDGKLAHMFVNGQRFDLPKPASPDPDKTRASSEADGALGTLAGSWTVNVDGQDEASTLILEDRSGTLGGVLRSPRGESQVESVTLTDRSVSILCRIERDAFEMEITLTGTLDEAGKHMAGDIRFGSFGTRSFKAERGPQEVP